MENASSKTYSDQVVIPTTAGGTLLVDVTNGVSRQDVTILNMDTTNFIAVGGKFKKDGTTPLSTTNGFPLAPGAAKTFRVSGQIWAIADTASCRVAYNTSEET